MNFQNSFNGTNISDITEIKPKTTLESISESYPQLSTKELNQPLDRCSAKDAPKEGLNSEQKDRLQKETKWSSNIVDQVRSSDEADIYSSAGLESQVVGDKECLVRKDIDLDRVDDFGLTNLDRMRRGRAPIDDSDNPIELHHIGQKPDNGLAELSSSEHRGNGNDNILHDKTQESQIDRTAFRSVRENHWINRAEIIESNK